MDLTSLDRANEHAQAFLRGLPDRRVGPLVDSDSLRRTLGGPLPEGPADAVAVIDELARAADPGLMATPASRFFGFVIGGAVPAALAADWLTSAWDQNAGLYAAAPSATIVEEIAGAWLIELFGLPRRSSFGFTTGATMASFTALAAARNHALKRAGWDVEDRGLIGAPPVRVIAGEQRHVTIDVALRYLGFGTGNTILVPVDDQGRMSVDGTIAALDADDAPAIVCTQAGNVNSGSFDAIGAICDEAHKRSAWVHVDGAFGLYAAVSPALAGLVDGIARADSWTTDAHKWLNVPYDCGFVVCAQPEAHRAAMSLQASYLVQSESDRDPLDWVPEFSRRARGFTVYAALRSLGRRGVTEMIERTCACARRFADELAKEPGVEILNDVVLNQVLVRFGTDDRTRQIIDGVQKDGTCWLGGTVWHERAAMRISVSNWQTTFEDVDRSVEAIIRIARASAGSTRPEGPSHFPSITS